MPIPPSLLLAGAKIEITVEGGTFIACLFLDRTSRVYDSWGSGKTIDAAVEAALDDLE